MEKKSPKGGRKNDIQDPDQTTRKIKNQRRIGRNLNIVESRMRPLRQFLNELNSRETLMDCDGKEADEIQWECGCMVRKCGACAMRINGRPRLACDTFLHTLKSRNITLEPLSKFPLVKDLIVDRSAVFKNLKKSRSVAGK